MYVLVKQIKLYFTVDLTYLYYLCLISLIIIKKNKLMFNIL